MRGHPMWSGVITRMLCYVLPVIKGYSYTPGIMDFENIVPLVPYSLQGTPMYPGENVPIWQVSLHHRFLNMEKIGHHSEKMCPDHRVSSHWSVPQIQVSLCDDIELKTLFYLGIEKWWWRYWYHCIQWYIFVNIWQRNTH